MSQLSVDKDRCKRDGVCVAVCPSLFLVQDEKGYPKEAPEGRCVLCGHCVAVCGCEALHHADFPEEEYLPAAKKLPDPAEIDSFLMSRRSVREFKDRTIPRETLLELLDVARRAPTASNSQKLHWIVVADKNKVHRLSEETIRWFRANNLANVLVERWDRGLDPILRGAPVLVAACAPVDYDWGKEDSAIALTYMELAAEARGYGICWAGFLTKVSRAYAPLRAALAVPEGYAVYGALMLGEKKYRYKRIPPRKPLSVQWN